MKLSKRTITVAAAASLLLLGIFLWLVPDDDTPPPVEVANGPLGGGSGSGEGDGIFDFGGSDEDRPGFYHARALRDMSEETIRRAGYPPDSRAIEKDADPTRGKFTVFRENARDSRHKDSPILVHYFAKSSFQSGEPIVLFAYLASSDGKKLEISESRVALMKGESAEERAAALTLPLRDDGSEGDEEAGDRIYAAKISIPAEMRAPGPQNYTLAIMVRRGEYQIQTTAGANVGDLNIRHTGTFRDRLDTDDKGTHLVVEADFQVSKAGFYYVQASMYDAQGNPIGMAQQRKQLQPGQHTIPLRFYGKMFCDSQVDGPYSIRYFGYMNVSEMPGPRSDPFEDVHRTEAYRHSRFSCNSFDDEDLLRKSRTMEQEAMEREMKADTGN